MANDTPDSIADSDDVALTEADLSNVAGGGKFVEEIKIDDKNTAL
jgi:hypothetical protein